jgi:hypothetical protein
MKLLLSSLLLPQIHGALRGSSRPLTHELGLPHHATNGKGLLGGSSLNGNSEGINSGVGGEWGGRALDTNDDDGISKPPSPAPTRLETTVIESTPNAEPCP